MFNFNFVLYFLSFVFLLLPHPAPKFEIQNYRHAISPAHHVPTTRTTLQPLPQPRPRGPVVVRVVVARMPKVPKPKTKPNSSNSNSYSSNTNTATAIAVAAAAKTNQRHHLPRRHVAILSTNTRWSGTGTHAI